MKQQTYTVEQKHIDSSDRFGDKTSNPIAKAIRDKIHRTVYIYNTESGMGNYDTSSGNIVYFTISKNALTLLKNFYAGKKVKPITFTITPLR